MNHSLQCIINHVLIVYTCKSLIDLKVSLLTLEFDVASVVSLVSAVSFG